MPSCRHLPPKHNCCKSRKADAEGPNSLHNSADSVAADVLTSGPMSVTSAKRMVAELDRWEGDDESLRLWTLDLTSRMRGSSEGQEGLSAFLEGRKPAWSPEDGEV